jgi:uncharacterized protein (TIGR02145 family)
VLLVLVLLGCERDPTGGEDPICGDGVQSPGEACDGTDLGGRTCVSLGYPGGGTLGCTATCDLVVAGCLGATCGDGRIDPGETCDGSDLAGATCASLGHPLGGILACASDCTLDRSGCAVGGCGDGVIDGAETCDGSDLGGQTCTDLGFHEGGALACASDCTLEPSGCSGGFCGDLIINGTEVCDGSDLSGVTCVATCLDFGFYEGELGCANDCTLEPSGCHGFCGDGAINGPEVCDGTDLGGLGCVDLGHHAGGSPACTPGCGAVSDGGCTGGHCGDGVRNGPEACDGSDLGGETCAGLGYHDGGALACAADCTLDVAACVGGPCGDGVVDPGEACDGTDLGGQTCAGLGYHGGGDLACTDECTLEVSGCLGGYCGDGVMNGAEVCDGTDLGGRTCADLGLIDGTLACDALCAVDASACLTGWTCGDALVDARDGRSYGTVALGGRCWMAANLDVGLRLETTVPQANNGQIEKYCYGNDPARCTTFGGLYQWDEAMQYLATEGATGICPAGWRLPTDAEWKALEIAAGMDPAVANLDQWRGPPAGLVLQVGGGSGFDVLLGGAVASNGASFNYPAYGYFWTSTLGTTMPWRRCFTSGGMYPADTIGRWETWPRGYALSIRCVTGG